MGQLTPFDADVIEILRQAGVIEDMNGNGIDLSRGVIVIRCPDGDQMLDRIEHDRRVAMEAGVTPRIHLITHHGGCMVVAPDAPLYPGRGIDEYVLEQIREAEALKEIHVISAEIHVPCGKATSCGLTLVHQIVLQMSAKPRIKEVDPTNKVICRIHVDFADGRKRTYFISRAKWIAFWNARGRALWGHLFKTDPYPLRPSYVQAAKDRRPAAPDAREKEVLAPATSEPMEAVPGGALASLRAARTGPSDTLLGLERSDPFPSD